MQRHPAPSPTTQKQFYAPPPPMQAYTPPWIPAAPAQIYPPLPAPPMQAYPPPWIPAAPMQVYAPPPAPPRQAYPPPWISSMPADNRQRPMAPLVAYLRSLGPAGDVSHSSPPPTGPSTSSAAVKQSAPVAGTSRKRSAATALSADIADFTHDCPVCLDEMAEPKLLHCGHNLCPHCVHNVNMASAIESTTPAADMVIMAARVKIKCPLCKHITKSSGPLATNYALKETVEKAKRMKLQYEALEAIVDEMCTSTPDMEPSIICADCGVSREEKQAFACTATLCTNRRRVMVTGGESMIYGRSYNIVVGKQLCVNCVIRSHRAHKTEEQSSMASESSIVEGIRGATIREEELLNLRNQVRTAAKRDEIKDKLLTMCVDRLVEYNNELRKPAQPLRKELLAVIDSRNKQFVERVKAAIGNKTKMDQFKEAVQQKANLFEALLVNLLK